jgi:2-methylaconitate cis-trans-isomerase PrpF
MATRATLEAIRKKVAEMMGIAVSQSIPKISFIAPAQDFKTITGKVIGKGSVSLLARLMAMGKMHKAFAITAGIPAAIGAVIPDSVVNQVVAGGAAVSAAKQIIIGHPSGMMDVSVEARIRKGLPHIVSCTIGRTARKIMDGRVYIPGSVYASRPTATTKSLIE